MENRIMQVFYGNDCLPYKDSARKVHYPIVGNSFLGANNTTEIRFYVRDIGGVNNVSWVAVSKLPNGKVGSEVLSTIRLDSELNEYYVVLNLSSYYTQMKGDVYISLNGYQGEIQVSQDADTGIYTIEGTPIIEATGSIKLSINYAPQVPQGQHFNISDLQQLLGAISEKTNIFNTIQIISDITQEDLSGYEDGQLFYDTYYNTYYQKNSLNETYGYVKADNGLLANQHSILRLSGSEYGSIGNISAIVGNRLFIFNYNNRDYLVLLSGTTTASALDVLDQQYYYRNDLTSETNFADLIQSQYKSNYVEQDYVDNAIATIKRNAFITVNTTTYPTLQSFLNSTGEEGYIYLYPLDSHDLSKGYYQYTYENNAWLYLGETNLDLSGYATKEELEDYSTTSESQTYTQNYVATTLQSYDLTIKSWVEGKDYATESQLNHNVHVEVQQHEFTFNGNTVTYTCSYVNLKTGATGSRQENIPLANSTTAGMMSSSDYNQIRSNTDRISALEGRQFRLSYTASSTPTATDIKNFVNTYLASVGITNPTDSDYFSVSVVVEATKHIWNYYVNDHAYKDDGLDTVSIFTNNVAGIILGTNDNESHTNDGKVYAENDGTGSVLGFDRLQTRVYNLENAGFITASVSNLQNYYDKTYIDTYIATKTWVQNQGYLTSLPSNVAYKDINNNFSVSQKIYGNDDTSLELVANDTTHSNIMFRDKNNLALGNIGFNSDKKPEINDKNTNTWRELALKDDTLKNAYHLGVADTYSVSNGITTITRKTGYVDLSNLEWGWNDSSSWWYSADLIGIVKPTASNSEIPNVKAQLYVANNLNTLSSGEIGVNTSGYLVVRNGSSSTKPSGYLEYETISSYTEQVPTDQPLNTLDQNGSEWLRKEWESQLNLWDEEWENGDFNTDGTPHADSSKIRSKNFIVVEPNTQYFINAYVGVYFYTSSQVFISARAYDNVAFTTPSNCGLIKFHCASSYGSTYLNNIMLNKGDHAYPYVPYNKFNGFLKDEYKKTLNLLKISKIETANATGNVTISIGGDGSLILNGTSGSNYGYYVLYNNFYFDGTYFISGSVDGNQVYIDKTGYPQNTSFTYTGFASINLQVEPNKTFTNYKLYPMLVDGNTPKPYEDYNGKIIHEKDLDTFESGENLYSGSQNVSGSSTTYVSIPVNMTLKAGTYILSATTNAISPFISFRYNGSAVKEFFLNNAFTISSDLIIDTIRFYYDGSGGTSGTFTYSNIMLNIGSTPQPFKDYVGAIVRQGDNVLLWTNPNPSDAITNQITVSNVGLQNYEYIVIGYKVSTGAFATKYLKVKNDATAFKYIYLTDFYGDSNPDFYTRYLMITASAVNITNICDRYDRQTVADMDKKMIPVEIWGSNVL